MSAAEYIARKCGNLCTVHGCTAAPCDDTLMCEPHRQASRVYKRAYYAARPAAYELLKAQSREWKRKRRAHGRKRAAI